MLEDIEPFGVTLLLVSVVVSVALLSNRISGKLRVPAPAIFLIAAAAVSDLVPALHYLPIGVVERIVTVALVLILFDGGMHIGVRKMRAVLAPVLIVGVVGTFLTAGAMAGLAHVVVGFPWLIAMLLGTALAPTDPAVVFSVLGNREVAGKAGVITEGESGANDPVGIALLISLLTVGATGGVSSVGGVFAEFAIQMAIGTGVGLAGGYLLLLVMRHIPLPSEGLYPLRTLAISVGLYGAAAAAGGSGFLAVFLAGIMIGDPAAPFKREIERFHNSLSSLAEIIAFVVLGLTVSLSDVFTTNAGLIGLLLAVLLALVVRPLLVGPLLLATQMRWGERVFVLWCGLKGAVPILLGTYVLTSGAAQSRLVYEIIFVVVAFSVIVQGGLVPAVAAWCRVPMREVEPRPYTLGLRLRDEPEGVHRFVVGAGSPADGTAVAELELGEAAWISLLVRRGRALHVRGDLVLQAGDEVLLLADPETGHDPAEVFTRPPVS